MNILCISGSAREQSSNHKLLLAIAKKLPQHQFRIFHEIKDFPVFQVGMKSSLVEQFKQELIASDAVIISTPEYIHNVPAQLKNALEWVTKSGELMNKRVIAITYTPNEPRGEKCMQSLLWSLGALDCQVVCQLSLYLNTFQITESLEIVGAENNELIEELANLI